MNEVVSVEAIGVPSHTKGSVMYAFQNQIAPHNNNNPPAIFLQRCCNCTCLQATHYSLEVEVPKTELSKAPTDAER